MSDLPDKPGRPDPRERPPDPAGTKPKVDREGLLPAVREPLVAPQVEGTAVEQEEEPDYLPERFSPGGAPALSGVEAPHGPRFQFLLGALFALGLAGLAGVIAVAMSGKPKPDTSWSQWRPNGDDTLNQIATHVGDEYHLGNGHQLVLVTGGALEVQNFPLTIALRHSAAQGGNISVIDGKGVLFRMCGLGTACKIAEGKPSVEREFLIRREALELALYAFHYTDADNVVAFLPPATLKPKKTAKSTTAKPVTPAKAKTVTQAMFFQRSDVDAQLSQPLSSTLTRTAPVPRTATSSPDAEFVDQLTNTRMFSFSLTQGNQDNRAFLVLSQG